MVPHALSDRGQQSAIQKRYEPLRQRFGLHESTVPLKPANSAGWRDLVEVERLVQELEQSQADTIISLGNPVIEHFLNRVCVTPIPRLTPEDYGAVRQVVMKGGARYQVVCLAHMRVTTIRPMDRWRIAHEDWIARNPML
jgi:hypothetical protein